jgi:hypothetical protein
LAGAIDAACEGLIEPILVGPAATIADLAKAKGIKLGDAEVVDVGESHAAAAKAAALVREGRTELVMKGSLHSDEILGAVGRWTRNCSPSSLGGRCARRFPSCGVLCRAVSEVTTSV